MKISAEEHFMVQRFGDQYLRYANTSVPSSPFSFSPRFCDEVNERTQ